MPRFEADWFKKTEFLKVGVNASKERRWGAAKLGAVYEEPDAWLPGLCICSLSGATLRTTKSLELRYTGEFRKLILFIYNWFADKNNLSSVLLAVAIKLHFSKWFDSPGPEGKICEVLLSIQTAGFWSPGPGNHIRWHQVNHTSESYCSSYQLNQLKNDTVQIVKFLFECSCTFKKRQKMFLSNRIIWKHKPKKFCWAT